MTTGVGNVIGTLIGNAVESLVPGTSGCGLGNVGACAEMVLITVIKWVAFAISWLVVIFALIFALFRTWWMLLKAYILFIIYVVTAPLMIMLGLLPSKPLGFEKWLRRMFVTLIVFPATALLICMASLLAGLYRGSGGSGQFFTPPLIGSPLPDNFGWLIAFGMLMVTPHLLEILQQNMGASGKSGQVAMGAVFAGAAVGAGWTSGIGKGVGGGTWKTLTRTNPYSGAPIGVLSKWASKQRVLAPILKHGFGMKVPSSKTTNTGGGSSS